VFHSSVRSRLQTVLLENVENERNGLLIDRSTMKSLLEMLEELSGTNSGQAYAPHGFHGSAPTAVNAAATEDKVYETEFETAFLEQSVHYYRQESSYFLSQNTCPDFVKKAESRIAEETQRCR
jgi:uncharacterized membrane-anchored protein